MARSGQSVGVYLACIGIRLVARGLVSLYEPLADFRQRATRSLFIVPNPSRTVAANSHQSAWQLYQIIEKGEVVVWVAKESESATHTVL